MKIFLVIAVALFVTLVIEETRAQDCDVSKDYKFISRNFMENYAYFDKAQSRTANKSDVKASAGLAIEGVPITGDFSSVNSLFHEMFTESGARHDRIDNENVILSTLTDNDVEAYKACLDSQSYHPLKIWFHDIGKDGMTLRLSWKPVGADMKSENIVVKTLIAAKVLDAGRMVVAPGSVYPIQMRRVGKKDVRVTVWVGSYTEAAVLKYTPVIQVLWEKSTELSPRYGVAGRADTQSFDITAPACSVFDTERVNVVDQVAQEGCGRILPDRIYGKIVSKTSTKLSALFTATQSDEHCGASFSAKIKYVVATPRIIVDGIEVKQTTSCQK